MTMLVFQRKRIRICPQDFVAYQVRGPNESQDGAAWEMSLGNKQNSAHLCVFIK